MTYNLPPLPDHPEPRVMTWSELELRAINAYGEECARAALAHQEPAEMLIDPSRTVVGLAEMVLSDCGCSSDFAPLLDRVATRIQAHVDSQLAQATRPLTILELADVTAPWADVWTDKSFGIANAAISKFCEVNGIAATTVDREV